MLQNRKVMKIVICASPELRASATSVALHLRDMDVDAVCLQDRSAIDSVADMLRPHRIVLIALAFQDEADAHHSALAVQLRDLKVSWLRTVISRSCKEFHVGPLFNPETAPCYQCALARLPRLEKHLEDQEPGTRDTSMGLFIAWIIEEIRKLDTESDYTPGIFTAVDLFQRQSRAGIVIRDRGCGLCGQLSTPQVPRSGYQEAIEILQDYFNAATSGSCMIVEWEPQHNKRNTIRASWSYDRTYILLPYQERSGSLKKSRLLASVWGRSAKTLELREIASLLRFTAGFRAVQNADRFGRRWCASAGDLGSIHLGVFSYKIPALPDGSYFYSAPQHLLGRALAEVPAPTAIMTHPDKPHIARFEVRVYGSYEQLAGKYGIFASRLVYLDIGAAVAQFLTYAAQLQLTTSLCLPVQTLDGVKESGRKSDRLGAVITVSSEKVTSIPERSLHGPVRTVVAPTVASCDKSDPKDIERFILEAEASCINDSSRYRAQRTQTSWLNILSRKPAPLSGKPCEQIFDGRKSIRHFSLSSVVREQALNIVSRSLRAFDRHTHGIKHPLKVVLIAENVSGLDRGQYRCRYVHNELQLRPDGLAGTGAPGGNAAFRCIVLGRSDGGSENEVLTYSQQLVLAGTLAHLFSLETTAEGLAGSVIARGKHINDLVPWLERLENIILCAFVCGCEPENEEVDHGF